MLNYGFSATIVHNSYNITAVSLRQKTYSGFEHIWKLVKQRFASTPLFNALSKHPDVKITSF